MSGSVELCTFAQVLYLCKIYILVNDFTTKREILFFLLHYDYYLTAIVASYYLDKYFIITVYDRIKGT